MNANNLSRLEDDAKSVVSHKSILSKGYYRAPRYNGNKRSLFKDNEKQREQIQNYGRTVTSEYDYSQKGRIRPMWVNL